MLNWKYYIHEKENQELRCLTLYWNITVSFVTRHVIKIAQERRSITTVPCEKVTTWGRLMVSGACRVIWTLDNVHSISLAAGISQWPAYLWMKVKLKLQRWIELDHVTQGEPPSHFPHQIIWFKWWAATTVSDTVDIFDSGFVVSLRLLIVWCDLFLVSPPPDLSLPSLHPVLSLPSLHLTH